MRARSIACWAAVGSMFVGAPGYADGLSPLEANRLDHGGLVMRTQELTRGDRRYVGGVTYAVLDARADDVAAVIDDVAGWHRILPRTQDTRLLGIDAGDALVEVTHGSGLVRVKYTIRIHRDGRTVRFWMDPSRPHDIEDVWGFIRADQVEGSRQLVTFGVLIDLGDGLLRDLFENRVRELALTVPARVRGVVERRGAAAAGPVVSAARARY
ncbi:MAG TPA: hypothetical protein VGM06_10270 [Polyangiaceae bacterium]|jgi:hypothetical protein